MQDKQAKQIRVGVGVWVVRNGTLLLGKRQGSHGGGMWAPPGGHMDFGEGSAIETARREIIEETGLVVEKISELGYTSDFFEEEDKHYITLWCVAHAPKGDPEICEPGKCLGWEWFLPENLPALDFFFLCTRNMLKKYGVSSIQPFLDL